MPKYEITATFVSEGHAIIEADDFDEAVRLATEMTSGDFEYPNGTESNIDTITALVDVV